MAVDFSIKQVPDDVADRLRERAERNHRSLQGELRAILDAAAMEPDPSVVARVSEWAATYAARPGTRGHVIASPSESALMIREDRDGRHLSIDQLHERVSAIGRGTPAESVAWIRELRSRR